MAIGNFQLLILILLLAFVVGNLQLEVFFYPSTPSMRKGHDREIKGWEGAKRKQKNMEIVVINVVASQSPNGS